MGRLRWLVAVLIAGMLLAGCETPRPEVTFFGNRTAVNTEPTGWCQADESGATLSCTQATPDAVPRLTLKPGQQVQINVPSAIGATPWGVYFRYLDATGTLRDGRTEIFRDGRLAYTLQPFRPDDQLTYVEVGSNFAPIASEQTGGVAFQATRAWLLLIDPAQGPKTDLP